MRPPPPGLTRSLWEIWYKTTAAATKPAAARNAAARTTGRQVSPREQINLASGRLRGGENPLSSFAYSVGGIFRTLRSSGPSATFNHAEYARPLYSSTARAFSSPASALRASSRRAFVPSARPLAHPSHPAHVGLGSARTFASARPVLQNIVDNVPLALRAFGHAGGIDERKWASEKKMIRRRHLREAKKVRASSPSRLERQACAMQNGLREYFSVERTDGVADWTVAHDGVVLRLPLEPTLPSSSQQASAGSSYAEQRLLTPAVMRHVAAVLECYALRGHQANAMQNALVRAGIWANAAFPAALVGNAFGAGWIVEIRFPTYWSVDDVCAVVKEVQDYGDAWYEIVDRTPAQSSRTADLLSSSEASVHEDALLSNMSSLQSDDDGSVSSMSLSDARYGGPPTASSYIFPTLSFSASFDENLSVPPSLCSSFAVVAESYGVEGADALAWSDGDGSELGDDSSGSEAGRSSLFDGVDVAESLRLHADTLSDVDAFARQRYADW